MRIVAFLAAGLVACSMVAATPASATFMVATYAGTVSGGSEITDVFGLGAGASLVDQAFTANFTYDPLAGIDNSDPGFYQEHDGGSYWGAGIASPIVDATLTINGITFDVGGDLNGEIVSATGVQSWDRAESLAGQLFLYLDYNAPGDLSVPVPTTTGSPGAGTFRLYDGSLVANGTLRTATLTIAAVAQAVPEPGTLALLLTGLGLMGLIVQRNRRRYPSAGRD